MWYRHRMEGGLNCDTGYDMAEPEGHDAHDMHWHKRTNPE